MALTDADILATECELSPSARLGAGPEDSEPEPEMVCPECSADLAKMAGLKPCARCDGAVEAVPIVHPKTLTTQFGNWRETPPDETEFEEPKPVELDRDDSDAELDDYGR